LVEFTTFEDFGADYSLRILRRKNRAFLEFYLSLCDYPMTATLRTSISKYGFEFSVCIWKALFEFQVFGEIFE